MVSSETAKPLRGDTMRTSIAVILLVIVAAFSVGGCRRSPACDANDKVSVELCGPRKEWVGQWMEDASPPRYIDIGPHGGYRFIDSRPHHRPLIEGDIVAFVGNDMNVRTSDHWGMELVILVTDPPHKVGNSWIMTADSVTYQRTAP